MKYRIKQIGDMYYPQRKFLGIWWNISVETCTIRYGEIHPEKVINLCFGHLKRANAAIINFRDNYLGSFKCRGHKIATFYDDGSEQYIYVDVNNKRIYDTNSEKLCERIAEMEDERIKKKKHDKKIVLHEFTED